MLHLTAEAPVDDSLLAGLQRVGEDACAVAAARDSLLQLVDAQHVQGQAHRLLELPILVAPAYAFVDTDRLQPCRSVSSPTVRAKL